MCDVTFGDRKKRNNPDTANDCIYVFSFIFASDMESDVPGNVYIQGNLAISQTAVSLLQAKNPFILLMALSSSMNITPPF